MRSWLASLSADGLSLAILLSCVGDQSRFRDSGKIAIELDLGVDGGRSNWVRGPRLELPLVRLHLWRHCWPERDVSLWFRFVL